MARDGGFTLLEVLVAFVIAALAMGALLQGAGGGLQSTSVSGHYQEALSRARSRLAALGPSPALGEQGGDDGGGYRWRTSVVLLAAAAGGSREGVDPPRPRGGGSRPVLLGVTVRVLWGLDGGGGTERSVVLATERLGIAPPDSP